MATHYATVTLDTVASTQDEARRLARETTEPVLVVAQRQVAGRGRSGRTWQQAPRALFSSLAFRPPWPAETWPRLALVAGLAVRSTLAELVAVAPGLKWPNDLVSDAGKPHPARPHPDRPDPGKLGGILTEAEGDLVVIGCGLNLWWPARGRDGSGRPPDVAAVCADDPGETLSHRIATGWASRVLAAVAAGPGAWDVDGYRRACVTLGEEITWEPSGSGRAVDIDPEGGLVVETRSGRITLVAGEIHTVRRHTPPDGNPGQA